MQLVLQLQQHLFCFLSLSLCLMPAAASLLIQINSSQNSVRTHTHTVVYSHTLSYWGGEGHAKIAADLKMFVKMFSGTMPEGLQQLSFTLINTIPSFCTFKQDLTLSSALFVQCMHEEVIVQRMKVINELIGFYELINLTIVYITTPPDCTKLDCLNRSRKVELNFDRHY